MPVLGIESTAHTLGVGIVEEDAADTATPCRILANERDMFTPEDGGIVPREAAEHHADIGPTLLQSALDAAGIAADDLTGVAFSQGPGLGPCLRVGATMARAFALRYDLPLAGVNHCVAHLEIGRGLTAATDPVLLYASGANTQVIAELRGRYRVFGETLDVGIGNGLDKFARDHGIPFPGGPQIERLAANSEAFLDMPYTVKGMDMVFAGLATKSRRLLHDGHPIEAVCNSLQEHAFAALTEVAERALAHTQKTELVLGGGVACNARLQAMAASMCEERGAAFYCPPRPVLVDNGAMIAWAGHLQLAAGQRTAIEASAVDAHWRTDQVDITWPTVAATAGAGANADGAADNIINGAEAVVTPHRHLGRDVLRKTRRPRAYRHPALDERIRTRRNHDEARLLLACRDAGVAAPIVYDVDPARAHIALQRIDGPALRSVLADSATRDDVASGHLATLGNMVARLHDAGLTHGDLTTSNVLLEAATGRLVLIDFGLGQFTKEEEPRGVDLHLIEEALEATDDRADALFAAFMTAYVDGRRDGDARRATARLEDIRGRGRYR